MKPMTFPSEMHHIHVSRTSVFRLEVQVLGKGHAPSENQCYDVEYVRHNQKWIMSVTHFKNNEYRIGLQAPGFAPYFSYKKYQRTSEGEIEYKDMYDALDKADKATSFFIGAEMTVTEGASAVLEKSPWNFESSDQMAQWDVILSVGESKFYAHKQTLSLVSTTFRGMLQGNPAEKGPQEVPVKVEGTNAQHFEAFLQCLYPCGSEPKGEFLVPLVTLAEYFNVKPVLDRCVALAGSMSSVPKLDKLRIAFRTGSTALEEKVVASLTKDDIRAVLASDLKDQLDTARWEKLVIQSLSSSRY